jgi:putative ABC transport system permease protein
MLELHNIHKTYQSKKSNAHQALSGIDLSIGDKGFIVLLGKSGSGKSTLLNILGGLDRFDQGEIIIKGKSTKDFKRNEWDAYRNTYVGFVFQEFYIIEEFTVGKNIALALELQGYPKDKIEDRVQEILKSVELEGYANRKPNEISGGQKQRIAIARALVKDPQIILADEPTGNLDSETGKIILDTLKLLSKDKLIIMVTHDEEFAYQYGDRIIELKDGLIHSDQVNTAPIKSNEMIHINEGPLSTVMPVSENRQLSQAMIKKINDQLMSPTQGDIYLTIIPNKNSLQIISPQINLSYEVNDDVNTKSHHKERVQNDFELKHTSLSWKNAFKLALSSILTRKVRLFFMTLLFVMSLIFVGVASTFSLYKVSKASVLSFEKTSVTEVPFYKYNSCSGEYCYSQEKSLLSEEIQKLEKTFPSIEFIKSIKSDLSFFNLDLHGQENELNYKYYTNQFSGFTLLDGKEDFFTLSEGSFPKENEVLISDYIALNIIEQKVYEGVTKNEELIGKTLMYRDYPLTITGIVDTDYEQFDELKGSVNHRKYKSLGFDNLKETYQYLYLTNETYNDVFNQETAMWFISSEDEHSRRMHSYHIAPPRKEYEAHLLGSSRLPVKDGEVVMDIDTLNRVYGESIDFDNITKEQIDSIIGKRYDIKVDAYDRYANQETKSYTLVGIIDKNTIPLYFSYLFSQEEYDYFNYNAPLDSSSWYIKTLTLTGILGDNERENTQFFEYLEDHNYHHKTKLSDGLYEVEFFKQNGLKFIIGAGIVFSLFTSILIFTFISSGIRNKQKDIGTLRAIGARGFDVSKIYIIEGLMIALFCSIVANILASYIIKLLNHSITTEFNLDFVVLYVNGLSILFVFLFSIVVVFLSSFIPIKQITLMRPINAIKKSA